MEYNVMVLNSCFYPRKETVEVYSVVLSSCNQNSQTSSA